MTRLGVDVYSVRSQGWDAFRHLEYAADIGLDIVHFSSTEPYARLDDGYLRSVRERANELDVSLEVGMDSICPSSSRFDASAGTAFEQVERMLHVASTLGSPILRCYLGSGDDRRGPLPLKEHIDAAIEVCRSVGPLAEDLGITLAIENHAGDLQGRELAELIERAGPEHVGACIDSGNPLWVAEDPLLTLERLAPYVVATHVRDTCVWEHPRGAAVQWVAMGDGNVDIETWVRRLLDRCPDVPVTLEIITGLVPRVLPFLEESFWDAYHATPAHEFARFLRLARTGQPYMGPMVTTLAQEMPPEYVAALRAQQRLDLERSVTYCRDVLGLGERRRQ